MTRTLLITAAIIPLLGACAAFQASAATPQQASAIQATCSKVMRFHYWQQEYGACVASLSDSLRYQVHADYAANAYRDCAQTGMKRETPGFSRCVLDRENNQRDSSAPAAGAASRLNASYISPADNDPRDYFQTDNNMRQRREQYSCAELGLEPDSSAFASCVKNLGGSIFEIEHPQG